MNVIRDDLASLDSYYDVIFDDLPCNFDNLMFDSVSIMNLNIRSLKSNFSLLTTFLWQIKNQPKVIVMTEPYLDDKATNLYNLCGYKKAAVNRPTMGGDLVIYVHNSLDFSIDQTYTGIFDTHESLYITLKCPNNVVVNIFGIYRPPSKSLGSFCTYLESLRPQLFRKNTVLVGDFNACPTRDRDSAGYRALESFLVTKNYRQLVKSPTSYDFCHMMQIPPHSTTFGPTYRIYPIVSNLTVHGLWIHSPTTCLLLPASI